MSAEVRVGQGTASRDGEKRDICGASPQSAYSTRQQAGGTQAVSELVLRLPTLEETLVSFEVVFS